MKQKITGFLAIVCAIALIAGCLCLGLREKKMPAAAKNASLSTRVKRTSGGCAQMACRGTILFTDGSIPIFDRKSFTLTYNAVVSARVDLSQALISPRGDTLFVSLPEPEITSVTLDDKTLSFSGNTYAIFNWTEKKDVTCAIASAKNAALKNAEASALKDEALESARESLMTLLKPLKTPEGRSYKISFS